MQENIINILIADDHQLIIDGLKSMLTGNNNYCVLGEANNGKEAFEIIASQPDSYQVIISDISMPEADGIELCRRIKKQYPFIKVLIMSMYSKPIIIKECIEAEADGFLLKNAGREDFFTALHRVTNDGTYFSQEVIPIIYGQMKKENKQAQEMQNITAREKEILKLIVQELTSEEIAQKLFISKKTVDNHRAHLLEKTNSKSTIGLVKFALQQDL
jgi:two-component system, NarL family, nitrate/nitrite response regulator NarL